MDDNQIAFSDRLFGSSWGHDTEQKAPCEPGQLSADLQAFSLLYPPPGPAKETSCGRFRGLYRRLVGLWACPTRDEKGFLPTGTIE